MTTERLRRVGARLAPIAIALAALGAAPAASANAADHWLTVKHGAEGRYVSGGVGIDERHDLARLARGYDLELAFATRAGNYLADVKVKITDGSGRDVISTRTDGPLLYAQLPPGRYRVSAEIDGRRLTRVVHVASGRRAFELFHWPGGGKVAPTGGATA